VWLLDTEGLPCLRLRKFPLFDDAIYLQCQTRLKKFLFRIGKTKVLKNIAATLFDFDLGLLLAMFISAPVVEG